MDSFSKLFNHAAKIVCLAALNPTSTPRRNSTPSCAGR
jgi:hypothetical protein